MSHFITNNDKAVISDSLLSTSNKINHINFGLFEKCIAIPTEGRVTELRQLDCHTNSDVPTIHHVQLDQSA